MRPYYSDALVTLYHGDCREVLPNAADVDLHTRKTTRCEMSNRVSLCARRDSNPQPSDPKSEGFTGGATGSAPVRAQSGAVASSRHTKPHTIPHRPLALGGGNTVPA